MVHKVAIVSGASQGIGAHIVKRLAGLGHHVVLVARGVEKLEQVQKEIAAEGGDSLVVAADVSDMDQVKGVVAKTLEAYGRIDILVNNAAYVAPLHQFAEGDLEQWNKMVGVNVWGALHMSRTVLPGMISAGSGHILFMSSRAGVEPAAGLAVHSGTKKMIEGVVEALGQEVEGSGVKLSVVRPGGVDTPGYHHTVAGVDTPGYHHTVAACGPQPDWITNKASARLTPDTVAKVVVDVLQMDKGIVTDINIRKE